MIMRAKNLAPAGHPTASDKRRQPRTPFLFGAKASGDGEAQSKKAKKIRLDLKGAGPDKVVEKTHDGSPISGGQAGTTDITEIIKTVIQIAREQGHLTYDDINEVLPDGVSPDDLDILYTKLHNSGIEVVAHAEVEKAKPEEPEVEEERSFEALDDPVRLYMNQMGKVPLLTREQEVEICKRIEAADLETKRLVYSLGFTAKEHTALAEKLLADPPKERFDRIVVDKKVTSRETHLQALRPLLKKVRALDAQVDQHYVRWQAAQSPNRRQKVFAEFQKLERKLQATFPKFFYKQKVLEDMTVVAANIQEKFQGGLKRIRELEAEPKTTCQRAALGDEA